MWQYFIFAPICTFEKKNFVILEKKYEQYQRIPNRTKRNEMRELRLCNYAIMSNQKTHCDVLRLCRTTFSFSVIKDTHLRIGDRW